MVEMTKIQIIGFALWQLACGILIGVGLGLGLAEDCQSATILLIGDSNTIPVVTGGGPGYPEHVADAAWFGCGGGTSGLIDTPKCAIFAPILPEGQTYLRDVAIPLCPGCDTATLSFGGNDAQWQVPEGQFAIAIAAVAAVLHDYGFSRVIFIGPLYYLGNPSPPDYYTAMLPVCNTVSYLECGPDFGQLLDPDLHYNLEVDMSHPNALGHEVLGDALNAYLAVPEPPQWSMLVAGGVVLGLCWIFRKHSLEIQFKDKDNE